MNVGVMKCVRVRSGSLHARARYPTAYRAGRSMSLNLINQGDVLFGMASINWLKLILTYCVPYAVCTYGAVSYQLNKLGVTLE